MSQSHPGRELVLGVIVGVAFYFAIDLVFFFLLPDIAAATLFLIKLGIMACIIAIIGVGIHFSRKNG